MKKRIIYKKGRPAKISEKRLTTRVRSKRVRYIYRAPVFCLFNLMMKMAYGLRRCCRRSFRVSNKSCWLSILIIAVILISSYTGILNDQEEVLPDTVSERWMIERLHTVIRPEVETVIIQPKLRYNSICQENVTPDRILYEEPLKLLILVASAPPNVEARNAIRYSWANKSSLPEEVEVYFVLGTTPDDKVLEIVKKEAEEYNDIIVEDFIDSYDNLTYKTLFALKWATRSCSRATHLLKTDDDMLIIPRNLMKRLIYIRDSLLIEKINKRKKNINPLTREKQNLQGEYNSLSKENQIQQDIANNLNSRDELTMTEQDTKRDEDKIGRISGGYILGKILRGVQPYRDRNSKWYIPYTLYDRDYLPDFASGTAYVIANGNKYCGAIKSLFINSLKMMPVLPLEDVFVTGVTAEYLNLQHIEDNMFSSSIPVLFPWTLSRLATCYYYDIVSIHGLKPNELITAWRKLQEITAEECDSILGIIHRKIYAMLAIFEMPNG